MTYSEKLKDPRWQKMRLRVMEYAEFRCQICGDGKSTLHVHHSYYTRGNDPWQYPMGSLICICEYHHSKIHEKEEAAISPVDENPEANDPALFFWNSFCKRVKQDRNLIIGLVRDALYMGIEGDVMTLAFTPERNFSMTMLATHIEFLSAVATDMVGSTVLVRIQPAEPAVSAEIADARFAKIFETLDADK